MLSVCSLVVLCSVCNESYDDESTVCGFIFLQMSLVLKCTLSLIYTLLLILFKINGQACLSLLNKGFIKFKC